MIHLSNHESDLKRFLETPFGWRPKVLKTQIERLSALRGFLHVQALIDTRVTGTKKESEYLNITFSLPTRDGTSSPERMRVRLLVRTEGGVTKKFPQKRTQRDFYYEKDATVTGAGAKKALVVRFENVIKVEVSRCDFIGGSEYNYITCI